jgi:Tol biopolymer transport system component
MKQHPSPILLILCAGALAGAGQDLPVNTAALGIKELAFEVPEVSYVRSLTPGSMLAYGQEVGSDIFVIDAQNSKPRKLISGGAHPAWSPDGSQLAYCAWQGVGYGQIEVANADGTGGRQITDMKGGACFPDWSPDGKKIVFTALSVGGSEKNLYGANNTEIFVVDKNGGDPVPIAPGYEARWSPGGTMLVFLRGPEKKGTSGSVWLATADGKQSKNLIASERRVAGATWLPNGKGIAVSSIQSQRYSIFRFYLDGSQPQGNQPQRIAGDDRANWTEPSVSPDGQHLMVIKDCSGGYWDANLQSGCRVPAIELLDLDTNRNVTLATGNNYSVIWEGK